MPEFDKTWKLHPEGPLLGTATIISPWSGSPTEAVVNIDSGKVIAAHGATCHPFDFIPSVNLRGEEYKGALREAPPPAISSIQSSVGTTSDMLYGDGPKPEMGLITLLSDAEKEQLARDAEDEPLDGEIETGLAAIIDPNPTGCNVCGEALHKGCCNPGRRRVVFGVDPASPDGDTTVGVIVEDGKITRILNEDDLPPHALTDAHARELERAIRAEGFTIHADPETGDIKLEKTGHHIRAGWEKMK